MTLGLLDCLLQNVRFQVPKGNEERTSVLSHNLLTFSTSLANSLSGLVDRNITSLKYVANYQQDIAA